MEDELMEAYFKKIQTDRVYIIESPSIDDLAIERTEGLALNRALRLADFDTNYTLVSSKEELITALEFIISDFYQKSGKLSSMPYIHISAHGNENGIELTNNDFFLWVELEEQLRRINHSIGYVLFP